MIISIKKWFSFLLLGLVSCVPGNLTTDPTPLPTLQPKPEFVLEVVPKESQALPLTVYRGEIDKGEQGYTELAMAAWDKLSGYNSEICVKIDGVEQIGDDFTQPSTITNRVSMQVDGIEIIDIYGGLVSLEAISVVDTNGQVLMRGVGAKVACGIVALDVGVHMVQFQFRQTSGNILEYQWQFVLTED